MLYVYAHNPIDFIVIPTVGDIITNHVLDLRLVDSTRHDELYAEILDYEPRAHCVVAKNIPLLLPPGQYEYYLSQRQGELFSVQVGSGLLQSFIDTPFDSEYTDNLTTYVYEG